MSDRKIGAAKLQAAESEQQEADRDQPAIIDLGSQVADDGHGHDRAQSARAHRQSRRQRRIAKQFLIKERQKCDRAVDRRPENSDQHTSDRKIAMTEDPQIDERFVVAQFANDESDKANDENRGCPADPARAEPVIFLSLVENHLQAAEPYGQKTQAHCVQFAGVAHP